MASSTRSSSVANADEELSQNVLGTSSIVFMVLAVAAPLAVVVALMPIAFAFGNGYGIPGTWLFAMIAMFLFAIGYVRIIPFIKNAGAFYAYISASLGRPLGLAAAYVAVVSYFSLCCSTLAALAFFAADAFASNGIHQVGWELCAGGAIVLLVFLAYRHIMLAATILSVVLIAEVVLVMVLNAGVVKDRGLQAFDIGVFSPEAIFTSGLGIALIYAFNSMIGIEGTAIYQEEAKNRVVTIPRATYVSVLLIGSFYMLTAWALSSSVGAANVSKVAAQDPGHFVTSLATEHLGAWGTTAFGTLVLTSALAATLGLFNNTTRYLYALARDGVLPRQLAKTHPRYRSPHRAGIVLSIMLIIVMGGSMLTGLDPLLNVSTSLVGLGSVGLMALLAVTSLGIPVYFARQGKFGLGITLAPAVGGLIIAGAVWLAIQNYSSLTGVDSAFVNSLLWILVISAIAGFTQALWLRAHRREIYNQIGTSRIEEP